MLNKLFKIFSGSSSKPDIDLSLGYARLDEFMNYLRNKQYQAFEQAYEALNWDEKTLLNDGIGLDEANEDLIQQWVAEQNGSYIANLFAGVLKTRTAWIARTAALGRNVSEEKAAKYFGLLEEAFGFLKEADSINEEDAEICARFIRVCMGLQVEKEDTYSYFNAAMEIEPSHFMAHWMMINFLNPKWNGSLEEMHGFADEHYQKSSLLMALKLFAFVEEWNFYAISNDKQAAGFFNSKELGSKINSLFSNYVEEEDGKSLVPYVYNYFAFLFYKIGEKDKAKGLIEKLQGKMTIYPWAYIGVDSNAQLQKLL
jgi:hypothetical protein